MTLEVRPATADRWDDVVAAFGRRGVDPSWCWCQLFLPSPHTREDRDGDHRVALRREVTTAPTPPGLLAYLDERPVGWSRGSPSRRRRSA